MLEKVFRQIYTLIVLSVGSWTQVPHNLAISQCLELCLMYVCILPDWPSVGQ